VEIFCRIQAKNTTPLTFFQVGVGIGQAGGNFPPAGENKMTEKFSTENLSLVVHKSCYILVFSCLGARSRALYKEKWILLTYTD
jgi:hypothetical protein